MQCDLAVNNNKNPSKIDKTSTKTHNQALLWLKKETERLKPILFFIHDIFPQFFV